MLREKFEDIAFIIPGAAMSAGTIMVMAGDEILMDPNSALGPIDAQVMIGKKRFPADAFLDGFKKIKKEVKEKGQLNRAYIPILQDISPADIQYCENAQDFAKKLVTEWLAKWKFKNWEKHSSTGKKVTEQEKKKRAQDIASVLCKHSRWLTHGRSIKIDDLTDLKLKITNYTENPTLRDAIRRYYTLLLMTFERSPIFKIYETTESQIYRFSGVGAPPFEIIEMKFDCPNCRKRTNIQANLERPAPLKPGNAPFPANNKFKCPFCGHVTNLTKNRQEIESQSGKKIVP